VGKERLIYLLYSRKGPRLRRRASGGITSHFLMDQETPGKGRKQQSDSKSIYLSNRGKSLSRSKKRDSGKGGIRKKYTKMKGKRMLRTCRGGLAKKTACAKEKFHDRRGGLEISANNRGGRQKKKGTGKEMPNPNLGK